MNITMEQLRAYDREYVRKFDIEVQINSKDVESIDNRHELIEVMEACSSSRKEFQL